MCCAPPTRPRCRRRSPTAWARCSTWTSSPAGELAGGAPDALSSRGSATSVHSTHPVTMSRRQLFTSESVTEGHPDKIADQISDAVLDAILADDPRGRVACETLVTTGVAVVAGEITTSTYVDIPAIVRGTLKGIGYTDA